MANSVHAWQSSSRSPRVSALGGHKVLKQRFALLSSVGGRAWSKPHGGAAPEKAKRPDKQQVEGCSATFGVVSSNL